MHRKCATALHMNARLILTLAAAMSRAVGFSPACECAYKAYLAIEQGVSVSDSIAQEIATRRAMPVEFPAWKTVNEAQAQLMVLMCVRLVEGDA